MQQSSTQFFRPRLKTSEGGSAARLSRQLGTGLLILHVVPNSRGLLLFCLHDYTHAMSNYTQDLAVRFSQESHHKKHIAYVDKVDAFAIWQEDKNYWKIFDPKKMNEYCYRWLLSNVQGKNLSSGLVRDFVNLLKWQVYKKIDDVNTPYISFSDKIYNTKTFTFEIPDPDYPSFMFQDYSSKELSMPTPRWDKFLEEVLVTGASGEKCEELIEYMYAVLGNLLIPDMKLQQMFYFYGSGNNGKSVLLDVMIDIIGQEFVSSFNVQDLTTKQFTLPGLVGKRANICNEEESKYVESSIFKALVTGEPIETRRLYGDNFSFRSTAKFIFATNKIPQFNQWDGGIERRVRIIPFYYKVPAHKVDTSLYEKLRQELPGIMGKIIERGIKPLVKSGFRLNTPDIVHQATSEFKKNTSPVEAFIEASYGEPSANFPGEFVANSESYREYRGWCDETGRRPVKSRTFIFAMKKVFPNIPETRGFDYVTESQQRGRVLVVKKPDNLYDI